MNAIAVVEDEVRELVRRRGIDPVEQPAAVRRLVEEVIADYDERSISGALPPLPDTRSAARTVFDAVAGFGPLQPYLDDPLVEEIWINEPTKVFVARAGLHELTTTVLSEDQVRRLVEKMLKSSGRRVDLSAPFVDAPQVRGAPRISMTWWGGQPDPCGGAFPGRSGAQRAQRPGLRRHASRQDNAAQLPRRRHPAPGTGGHRRGSVRAHEPMIRTDVTSSGLSG